jgi:ribosome recycling factor
LIVVEKIKKDAETRMKKAIDSLNQELARMRTGRAHPGLVEHVKVDYYGNATPLSQVANVTVEDSRTLSITPWEKSMVPAIEKAIMSAGLGLNPVTAGTVIRIPMPPLTEERRREFVKVVKQEAENARVGVRNVRRDANTEVKKLLKDKKITEDDERRAEEAIQKLTDKHIEEIDKLLVKKEKDLMEV